MPQWHNWLNLCKQYLNRNMAGGGCCGWLPSVWRNCVMYFHGFCLFWSIFINCQLSQHSKLMVLMWPLKDCPLWGLLNSTQFTHASLGGQTNTILGSFITKERTKTVLEHILFCTFSCLLPGPGALPPQEVCSASALVWVLLAMRQEKCRAVCFTG